MKKVKLTREQADALKLAIADYGTDNVMDDHDTDNWRGRLEPLNDLPHSELARALYVGYEIVPKFKVGDWITFDKKYGEPEIVRIEALSFQDYWQEECAHWGGGKCLPLTKIRHATESEITEEKQRIWWLKNDRGVWELKQGDIIMGPGRVLYEITADPKSHACGCYTGNDERDFDIIELKNENYSVVCFVEDRKDV